MQSQCRANSERLPLPAPFAAERAMMPSAEINRTRKLSSKEIKPKQKVRPAVIGAIILAVATVVATIAGAIIQSRSHAPQNSNMHLTGRVMNAKNKIAIHDAKVSVELSDVPQLLFTDSEGIYHLDTDADITEVNIRVEADGYEEYDRKVPIARTDIEDIFLTPVSPPRFMSKPPPVVPPIKPALSSSPAGSYIILVNKLRKTEIKVIPGNHVHVEATGSIHVGKAVGDVTPDGKIYLGHGLLRIRIAPSYNIVSGYPHGALIWRVQGEPDWKLCGSNADFDISSRGVLEFQINDADQSDNNPHDYFHVNVAVTR